MKTMQQVSPVHSVPEVNWTSSISLKQLEHVLHLLLSLSCNNAAGFPVAVGIREDSQSSRFCKYSGEAIIFRSGSESAVLSAESYSECIWHQKKHIGTNCSKFLHIFCRRTSHKSFVDLIRICSKVSVKVG